jgi:hypothetical protein
LSYLEDDISNQMIAQTHVVSAPMECGFAWHAVKHAFADRDVRDDRR